MKSFTMIFESMLTKPAMPTWVAERESTPAVALSTTRTDENGK